jgi:hypothetical protein
LPPRTTTVILAGKGPELLGDIARDPIQLSKLPKEAENS